MVPMDYVLAFGVLWSLILLRRAGYSGREPCTLAYRAFEGTQSGVEGEETNWTAKIT